MGCLRLTYEEDESPLRVSREEENVSVEWQVWVNVKPAKKVKEAVDQSSGGDPNVFYVYSPDQVGRIIAAGNDGEALIIALYGVKNPFVDGNGNSSNYAERLFGKKFPKSKVSFPGNGRSASFIGGTNGDIVIKGLNFETGQFDNLRHINVLTTDEKVRSLMEVIIKNGVDEVINRIFRLPPIFMPPGTVPRDPYKPPMN